MARLNEIKKTIITRPIGKLTYLKTETRTSKTAVYYDVFFTDENRIVWKSHGSGFLFDMEKVEVINAK